MNNNQDQFQKDMYQVPASQSGEDFDTSPIIVDTVMSDEAVDQRFDAIVQQEIAREEIVDRFNRMTRNLEMAADGTEELELAQAEALDPVMFEIAHIAMEQEAHRAQHHRSLVERAGKMGFFSRVYVRLAAKDPEAILNPTIDSIINQESELGLEVFTHASGKRDKDIADIQFFLHDGEWFHKQKSHIPAKTFTNKYELTAVGILKSSTFFNEQQISVHESAIISDNEAHNLLIATRKHFALVTTEIYGK
ncbi:MAG TPA: hypothetical protein VIM37_02695 [Candidatus Microsaccharimonas sp.]|jgi:hypothetical protein